MGLHDFCEFTSVFVSGHWVDSILQQRKRKGVLEYLVKWKETGDEGVTWEPAANIKKDCAQAVESFEKSLKSKRSSSRSRKSSGSRSRSRSSSRSRKARQATTKKATRSSSRGRTKEASEKKAADSKGSGDTTTQEKSAKSSTSVVQSESKMKADKKEEVTTSSSSATTTTTTVTTGRVLRSSTSTAADKSSLEVQRVHNDQRPVREDDAKPRSAIWKVADYAVIILFIISALAALVLFIEKFVDLEDFKKQAYPNLSVLQGRLAHVRERVVEFGSTVFDKASDLWLQVVEQIKGTPNTPSAATTK